jgi:hypothetical protein
VNVYTKSGDGDPMDAQDNASAYLQRLARRNAIVYATNLRARAVLLMGSAAEEQSDFYSDLDMAVYYDELPTEEELVAARQQNRGFERLWWADDRNDGECAEAYLVDGVECQIAHGTIAAWERDMTNVLEKLDVASPTQKVLEGLLHGIPLHGQALIEQWKTRVAHYPDALAEAMVKHHLALFPIWYLQERLITRDSTLWCYQIFVEDVEHILGLLAGLNRLYYSTFQFKRMRRFIAQMRYVPSDAAQRLENVFTRDRLAAVGELEALVADTLLLLEEHMPQVDTTRVRRRLGQRQQPWHPV